MQITFPSKTPSTQPIVLEGNRFVILGANGSGKTRFGIWLEENNHSTVPVHRVAAQKALSIPEYAQLMNSEQAEKNLLFGRSDQHASVGNKRNFRWGNDPATHLLSDYDKVLSLLFARTAERDYQHTQATRSQQQYIPVPDAPIDSIAQVWADVMPHRSLTLHDGEVTVGKGTLTEYHGKDMSDGERVALYLLGQCLGAPQNSILIVDEPELHLHKSLMDKLWNRVEELSPTKAIVYITHDLDFAASRSDAGKIWVKSYAANSWTWEEVPSDDVLPEALVLELIGNRKPVLFCEGERGGLDHTIYQLCFPNFHVIPRGGSEKVIESTKAILANPSLHTLAVQGVVDRDVRDDYECAALDAGGVHVLALAEVENLLCIEPVVRLIAAKLSLDPDATALAVTRYVSTAFAGEFDAQVVMHAERRIRYSLSKYSRASSDEPGLTKGLADLLLEVDIPKIVADARKKLSAALSSGALDQILRVYNRKSLAERISACFGMTHGEYPNLVLRTMKTVEGKAIVDSIRPSLPRL